MKRDWALIREILLKVEGAPVDHDVNEGDFTDREASAVSGHVGMLGDAGLLRTISYHGGFAITGLTWEGHDFLDSIRSEGAMAMVKEKAVKVGGGLTFELVKAIGSAWVKAQLGL